MLNQGLSHRGVSAYEDIPGAGYPELQRKEDGTSLPISLLKIGALMAAFPLITGLAERGLAGAGRRVAQGVAARSIRHVRMTGRPLTGFAGEFMRSYARRATAQTAGPAIGTVLKGTSSVRRVIDRYRGWQRGAGIDISAYGRWSKMIGRQTAPARFGTKVNYAARASQRMARRRAYWRGRGTPAFRGRIAGSVENFLREYGRTLPGFIIADKAIGLVTGRPERDNAPAWWNLPGRSMRLISDFARTATTMLPIQLAFRGLGGAVTLTKDAIERSVRYRALSVGARSARGATMSAAIHGAATHMERARSRAVGTNQSPGIEARLRGATREFFKSFSLKWRGSKPRVAETLRYWGENVRRGWERGYIPHIHPLTQVPPSNLVGDLEKIRGIPLQGQRYQDALASVMKAYDRPKTGYLARIAGLRPLKVGQMTGDQTVESVMSRRLIQNLPGQTQDAVRKWLNTRYYGKGVFSLGRGRAIDMRRWKPTEVFSRAVDWAQERVVFAKRIKPFEIMHAKRVKDWMLGKSPNVYEWTAGHRVRVGPVPPAGGAPGTVSAVELGGSYHPFGAYVELTGDQRITWVKSPSRGRGAGRLFFYETGEDTALEFIQDKSYKLVETPLKSGLRQLQDIFYLSKRDPLLNPKFSGMNPQEEIQAMQEEYGWSKAKAWFHQKVLKRTEVGAGYGTMPGPVSRTRNLFMKYFDRRSPLVYMSEERGFLADLARGGIGPHNYVNEGNLDPVVRFVGNARNALNESLDDAWHIIKRRELYQRYSSHRVQLGDRSVQLGEIFDDSATGRTALVDVVRGILATGEPGSIPAPWEKARHIMETIESDEGFWSHIVTKTRTGRELTALDELQKFVFRHHLIGRAITQQQHNYMQGVVSGINLGRRSALTGINKEETLMRSVDVLAQTEAKLAHMRLGYLQPEGARRTQQLDELLGALPGMSGGRLNDLVSFLMGQQRTLADLSKVTVRPWSTELPLIQRVSEYSATTTSPYEVVIGGGFPDVRARIQEEGLIGGVRSALFPKYGIPSDTGELVPGTRGAGGGLPLTNVFPLPSRFMMEATMRFERLGQTMGFGLNLSRRTTYQDIWKGIFSKIVLPGIGAYAAYNAVDTFFDEVPAFEGTMFDEGLTVAAGEQFVKARLLSAKMSDITGVTSAAQYLEGLMPGSVDSPLSKLVRGVGPPLMGATIMTPFGPTAMGAGMIAGTAVSAMSGFGLSTLTKGEEELEGIYAGRELVPVRSGRWWEMGRTPLAGGRIRYWRPGWFPRLKSQYRQTPTLFGSKAEEFFFNNPLMKPASLLVDPYHWERKSYLSAPYPETGSLFEGIPFAGPVLSATAGKLLKPPRMMHRAELAASFAQPSQSVGRGQAAGVMPMEGLGTEEQVGPFTPAYVTNVPGATMGTQLRHPAPVSMYSPTQAFGRSFYRGVVEPYGLWGWSVESMMGRHPFESETVMANAAERTSFRRYYWDLQLGGLLGTSEYFRRFYPRMRKQIERWNPLTNRMPGWLPGGYGNEYFIDFRSGDPFTKIEEGELRLPGWGNMAAYHNKLSFPFSATQLGRTYEEMVQTMTGTLPPDALREQMVDDADTTIHKIVNAELRRANLLVKAKAHIFEPYSNISGSVDAIVRSGRRKVALEIKTISDERLAQLSQPDRAHRSQMNFYLKGLGLREGVILYLSKTNPAVTRAFPVGYDVGLYRADLGRLQAARGAAGDLLSRGYGYPGEGYSHLDRLRVLADVAPYSDEYKMEYEMVQQMDRVGLLSSTEHREKINIVKRRRAQVRTYDLYPRRFRMTDLLSPDPKVTTTNTNEFIKAAAEYSFPERAIGSAWEYLTHQRSPVHTKLLATYTPREQYERFALYGRRSAFWTEPYRDFIEPYMRASIATQRPDEGVYRGLQTGALFAGAPGAVVGAGVMGVYGAVHGAYRFMKGTPYIPSNVKGKWDVYDYFDKLKYLKARRLYQMTGEEEYAKRMSETMAGLDPLNRKRQSFTNIARAVPYEIKPFIFEFIRETDEKERDRIAAKVPPTVAQLLRIKWAQADSDSVNASTLATNYSESSMNAYFGAHHLPGENWAGFHPDVPLEDVQLKTVERLGYDAHDFGMGWYDQMRRIKYSPLTPRAIDMTDPTGNAVYPEITLNSNEARTMLMSALQQAGVIPQSVSVSVTPGVASRVYLDVYVDQTEMIQDAITANNDFGLRI